MMRKHLTRPARATLLILIPGALGVLSTALWLLLSNATPGDSGTASRLAGGLALICIATLCNLGLRWLRWHFLLRRLGARIPARHSALIFALLLPAIITPFALGEVLLAVFLRSAVPRPWRTALASWLIARSCDVVALLMLANLGPYLTGILIFVVIALLIILSESLRLGLEKRAGLLDVVLVLSLFLFTSLVAWSFPVVGLFAAAQLLAPIGPIDAAAVFAKATLLGQGIGSPGGLVLVGSAMIDQLQSMGMPLVTAVQLVLIFRGGTTVFAAALGVLTWALCFQQAKKLMSGQAAPPQAHFDELSGEYEEEIPAHMRERLLGRKIAEMHQILDRRGLDRGARGLDLGCGQGWYVLEMARLGYAMSACDLSNGQLALARENAARQALPIHFEVASVTRLPFPDNHFDFIYSVNVMHHVTEADHRTGGWSEIVRVLKPGGIFILQEMNVRNPLFRLYMSYVFPLLKRIDDGTEQWILPSNLPQVPGAAWDSSVAYFTFFPDFLPKSILRLAAPLERLLERSPFRVWSAHYLAFMVKRA